MLTGIAGMSLVAGLFLGAGTVLAVHDLDFQLDGNTADTCPPSPDTGLCDTDQQDWNDLFTVTPGTGSESVTSNTPIVGESGDFTAATFTRDLRTGASTTICKTDPALSSTSTTFCTYDNTTFATGSKDTLDIPGWACNADNNVNSKIDIMNAYSGSYTRTSDGDKILYFGLDKNKDNGTNDAGFWFLQGDANCAVTSTSGAHPSFTGGHKLGDVLVVAEYSRGGGVGNITAYRWDGVTPLVQIANAGPGLADCKTKAALDDLCGTTNSGAKQFNTNITTSWLTSDATLGVGHTVVPPDFFEGAINITEAFKNNGGATAPTCFNTYVADTRSSTSLTATLFDFARGRLGECSSRTTTNPVDATDNTLPPASTIPTDPADAKVEVKDKTVITVSGVSTFSGSISWFICGNNATTNCDSGGVSVGSQNITTAGTYYSPKVTVTAAGTYCFRAVFSGDEAAGVPGSSDSDSSECFTVSPVTPTIATQAGAGTVDFGSPVTDTATLTGTAHRPGTGGPSGATPSGSINPTTFGGDAGGTITFTLYKSDCSTLATGTGTNPQTRTVSGDGDYGPVSFTPDAPGTYYWDASYPADSPNTNAATNLSPCPSNSEKVIVRTISTNVITKQSWIPNDTVTVSASAGNLGANGSVLFELFDNATCSNTALYSQSVAITGGGPTQEVSTTNTGSGAGMLKITTGYADAAGSTKGKYSWRVTYTPNVSDTAHTGSSSSCDAENFTITYTNDNS